MKKTGIINRWDTTKGFGFIRSPEVSADIFFHIDVFNSIANAVPHAGMPVSFEEIHVGGKGPKATYVCPLKDESSARKSFLAERQPPARTAHTSHQDHVRTRQIDKNRSPARTRTSQNAPQRLSIYLVALTLWVGLISFGIFSQRLVIALLAALAMLNIATIFAYAFDKNAAERGWWRTKEDTLHLLALAGGWPAAWLAQQLMRHKTNKQSFQSAYWWTVWLNCAGLAVWIVWLHGKVSVFSAPSF